MAIEHYRHPPKRRTNNLDPELVAIIRILVVTGALAVLLGVLNHLV
ncbi:hypothetical protein [Kribbella catacumbae]|nr:hypothetical protein [Kribbella catacumbae]